MKLGEWLKKYRVDHNMSMQEMADVCGFSKTYVSLLEKGINPTTKRPFSPSMHTFEKIARATGQDVDSLLKILDDEKLMTVKSSSFSFSEEERKLVNDYRNLNFDNRLMIDSLMEKFLAVQAVAR